MYRSTSEEAARIVFQPPGRVVRRYRFGPEPGVAELLNDPIAHALMAADKTDRQSVVAVLAGVHGNFLRGGPCAR